VTYPVVEEEMAPPAAASRKQSENIKSKAAAFQSSS